MTGDKETKNEKIRKYLVDSSKEIELEVVIYEMKNGNYRMIEKGDEGNPDRDPAIVFAEDVIKSTMETIHFIRPHWALTAKMERAATVPNILSPSGMVIDEGDLARQQLRYCLRKLSFFDLGEVQSDVDDDFYVNVDELLGSKGLNARLVADILRIIRRRFI